MERHLNLIKTGHQEIEKRVFPRFPFSYLIFKENGKDELCYEVNDISYSGMQISLKDGEAGYKEGDEISGEIHWYSQSVIVKAKVQRVIGKNLGLSFLGGRETESQMKSLLSMENIASSLKPIHQYKEQMEIPANLAFWLRCDGPFEVFVWQHNNHEISKIQVIMMENFVEWNDGLGLKSGKILSIKNHDTPLVAEEEFEFLIDDALDEEKLTFAKDILLNTKEDLLPEEVLVFVKRKMGVSL